jgi:hypothetical protein
MVTSSAIACTDFLEGIALECYKRARNERGVDDAYNGYGGNSSSNSLSSSSHFYQEEVSIAVCEYLSSSDS